MVDIKIQKTGAFLLAALLLVAGTTGCQSIRTPTVFSRIGAPAEEKVNFEQPHRMAIIWTNSTMPTSPGKKPTRGFGGRVYFYNAADAPIRVDGELAVYAFDDSGIDTSKPAEKQRAPERKYVFRGSELQQHFSQTKIGPSYSVWVPWDEIGGEQVNVSLLPMFKPVKGQILSAGQSIAVLPGTDSATNDVAISSASLNEVRQASATLPDGSDYGANAINSREENARRRRTTTIDLPRNLSRQMQKLPTQPVHATTPARDARTASAPPAAANDDATGMTDSDKLLYQRVTDESTRGPNSGRSKRQPVFGSPGPFR